MRVCQRQRRHLWEPLRLSLPPFTCAFLKSPSSRGLSAIAELYLSVALKACEIGDERRRCRPRNHEDHVRSGTYDTALDSQSAGEEIFYYILRPIILGTSVRAAHSHLATPDVWRRHCELQKQVHVGFLLSQTMGNRVPQPLPGDEWMKTRLAISRRSAIYGSDFRMVIAYAVVTCETNFKNWSIDHQFNTSV